MQFVITTGNQGVIIALDGYHMVRVIRSAELFQRLVENLAGLAKLDAQQNQCASVDIPALTYPRHFQSVGDVDSCQHLWVNERVDAHLLKHFQLMGSQIFNVVDTSHRLLSTQCVGYHASRHVATFFIHNTHKEVGMLNAGFLQCLDAGGRTEQGHDVITVVQSGQSLRIFVYQDTILMIFR